MARPAKIRKLLVSGLILGLVLAVTFGLLRFRVLERWQLQLSSKLYQTRVSEHPILLVGVDQYSVDSLGQTAVWTRDKYAQAIRNISKYQPAAIGLDYYFLSKGKFLPSAEIEKIVGNSSQADQVLNDIKDTLGTDLNKFDRVLADEVQNNSKLIMVYPNAGDFNLEALQRQDVNPVNPPASFVPADKLRMGTANYLGELDSTVRRYTPILKGREYYPSFALALIAKYLGAKDWEVLHYDANRLEVRLGEKVLNIPLKDYQFLLNFSSKFVDDSRKGQLNPKTDNYRYLSFLDVYNDDLAGIDTEWIKGKIVLIGPYTINLDNYKVPIDDDYRMYGVHIHGQAIQTILDQAWLREMTWGEVLLTVGVVAGLVLAAIFVLAIGWALPAVALLVVLYMVVVAPWLFGRGLLADLVHLPLSVLLTAIIGYAWRFVSESRDKTRAATALGQFVNEGVAREVLAGGQMRMEKKGERRAITVLFSDIKGFTTISEKLQPQSVVALLNEYLEVMSGVIIKNNGIVDKYEGDAVMAFFEEQPGLPSHQERATRAALDMREALPGLLAKWRQDPPLPGGESKPEIDFRVGLSSGEAIVGTIGSSQHLQYTAIGDIVNLGSRLESANKQYQTHVMLAEATFEAVQNVFACRFLDVIRVKGKDKAVKIYELLGPIDGLSSDQAALLQAYNQGLTLYFNRQFAEAVKFFNEEVLIKWPRDYLANVYAARAQKCVLIPPDPDWDFVYTMQSK